MSKQCAICGSETIFFKWSSTRDFPRKALIRKLYGISDYRKQRLATGRVGVPVCIKCSRMLEKELKE